MLRPTQLLLSCALTACGGEVSASHDAGDPNPVDAFDDACHLDASTVTLSCPPPSNLPTCRGANDVAGLGPIGDPSTAYPAGCVATLPVVYDFRTCKPWFCICEADTPGVSWVCPA